MSFEFSNKPRTIRIFNLRADTNEFIGESDAYIAPHTGLPANSTNIAPPDIPNGNVAVFDYEKSEWRLVEDHRGKTVYSIEDGSPVFISELGPLPINVITVSPDGEYQKWNGVEWIKDVEAEKSAQLREATATKERLMQIATDHISPLQDGVDLDIATLEEQSALTMWKRYRVLLNRVDTSTAPDICWPEIPVVEL